jgi:phospholipase C
MPQQPILPQIKKVVFLMLENRSLDNLLGWLYPGDEQPARVYPPEGNPRFDGLLPNTYSNPDANGQPIFVQPIAGNIWKECQFIPYSDPFESMLHPSRDDPRPPYNYWLGVMNQFFGGKQAIQGMPTKESGAPGMKGFYNDYAYVLQSDWHGHDILWTYTAQQLPVINKLARQFAVSDRWFASVPSNTNPNRAYSLCGTSLGRSSNQNMYAIEQFNTPTIFNYLTPANKSWGLYYHKPWQAKQCYTAYTFPQLVAAQEDNEIAPIAQFFAHAKAGTLPDFSYLEPAWTSVFPFDGGTDYHPPSAPSQGAEQFLQQVYDAVRSSPQWKDTLLIITFDEHGGTYDHVAPAWGAINPDGLHGENFFDFDLFGARVPTILVSPYVPASTVFRPPATSKFPFDHTSFIKTLLLWAGVDLASVKLGDRMPQAPTFEGLFADHPVNDGVIDFGSAPLAAGPAAPVASHPAGDRATLTALLEGIPVVACRVLLAQNVTSDSLRAAVARYRQDPARFEAQFIRQL